MQKTNRTDCLIRSKSCLWECRIDRYCKKIRFTPFLHNQIIPSTGKAPLIFVDRKRFSHATVSWGCRYLCNFTQSLEGLGSGDVAVFSVGFNVSLVKDLRSKGVLIAFESGESPVHMPSLSRDHLEQVRLILNSFFSFV